MRLAGHFDSFLRNTVNLNQTRINRLNNHVSSVQDFLKASNYEPRIRRFSAQGSWAHKTIIKPLENKEFDADLVMFVRSVDDWSAKDYVQKLYQIFKESGTYKDKVSRNTRCVTLNYSGDFHLDVVPCIVTAAKDENEDKFEVCNARNDEFEQTKPEEYTAWLAERNAWTGKNHLRKVTRLVKYLRDIKGRFGVKSILLTTLLGRQTTSLDQDHRDELFCDLPTSLITVFGRLDDFLQENLDMPEVHNPVLHEETFTRHWDQQKYENFRKNIHTYRQWMDDAFEEPNRSESIRKWRRVFGDLFAKGEILEEKAQQHIDILDENGSGPDIVDKIKMFGSWLVNKIPGRLPHVQERQYVPKLSVFIKAHLYDQIGGAQLKPINSAEMLEKDKAIKFEAQQKDGLPFPRHDYAIEWRVVNTGKEAREKKCLRGDFYESNQHGVRWEETLYRGAHWVEAFVILRRKNQCYGKSDRFFVIIE